MLTSWARPCSTPPAITLAALPPKPCSAMTGRSAPVCPGGRAIAQLVLIPPRAAETNDPVTIVGAAVAAGAGSSGAGGASGAPTPVIDTDGPATEEAGPSRLPSAVNPAGGTGP